MHIHSITFHSGYIDRMERILQDKATEYYCGTKWNVTNFDMY